MASKTIRIAEEDLNRLVGMRTVKLMFIKDVITHLIDFYDKHQTLEEKAI